MPSRVDHRSLYHLTLLLYFAALLCRQAGKNLLRAKDFGKAAV